MSQGNKTGDNPQKSQESAKVFVKNLDFSTTWHTLKDFMRQVGPVQYADILKNKDGKSRGIGVVEFKYAEDAYKAMDMLNQKQLDGRRVFIKFENDQRKDNYDNDGGDRNNQQYDQNRYQNNGNNYGDNMNDNGNFQSNKGRFEKFRGGLANNSSNNNQQMDRDSSRDYNYQNNRRNSFRSRSRSRSGGRAGNERGYGPQNGRGEMNMNNNYQNDRFNNRSSNSQSSLQIQKRNEIDTKKDGEHYTSTFRQQRQIFVGNMPFTVTRNQFKEAFKEFGDILEICMLKDERSGKFNGRGTILFQNKDSCKNAVRVMDQAKFNDRVVWVKEDEAPRADYQQHEYDEKNNFRTMKGDLDQNQDNYDNNRRGGYPNRDNDFRSDRRSRERNNYSRNDGNFYNNRKNSFDNQLGGGNQGYYRDNNRDFGQNRNNGNRVGHNNQNKY